MNAQRQRTLVSILALLFAGSAAAYQITGVEVEPLVKGTTSWDGATLPAYPSGQPEITVLRYRIEPGARLPLHQHPVINAAVMLRGELLVTAATGETHRLVAGDAILELVETAHWGENIGAEPVELIVFYAGAFGQALSERVDPEAAPRP